MSDTTPEQERQWYAEFEVIPLHQIKRMIEAGNLRPLAKERAAQRFLDERNPAWAAVAVAKGAKTLATWALIIAGIAALAAVIALFK